MSSVLLVALATAATYRPTTATEASNLLQNDLPMLVYFLDSTDINSMRFLQHHLPKVEQGLAGALDIAVVDVREDAQWTSYWIATMDVQAIPSLKLRLNAWTYREYDREWKTDSMVAFALQMLPAVTSTTSSSSSSSTSSSSSKLVSIRVNDRTSNADLEKATVASSSSSPPRVVVVMLLTDIKDKTTITAFRSAAYAYNNNRLASGEAGGPAVRFVELKETSSGTVLGKELKAELVKGKVAVAVWRDGQRLGVATDAMSVRTLLTKALM